MESKNMTKQNSQDYICLLCGEDFDEQCVQCGKCREWAHEECADLGHSDYYYCDNCTKK
jgi:hypothetical protein